jgi:hypothetical protein
MTVTGRPYTGHHRTIHDRDMHNTLYITILDRNKQTICILFMAILDKNKQTIWIYT